MDHVKRAGEHFLDRYEQGNGRVVRIDQGGDTVSEGQAYAMLIAVALHDRDRFDAAWSWAKAHLLRTDGLMSYLWKDGRVQDQQAATDADLDAAHALILAADRFDVPAYATDGKALAQAVLDHETATVAGRLVLTAGPWANTPPPTIDLSYANPRAFAALSAATGDHRWADLAAWSRDAINGVSGAYGLPPTWAKNNADGNLQPVGGPDGQGEPVFTLDAQRIPIRYGIACDAPSRAVAAALWPKLRNRTIALSEGLDGSPRDGRQTPVGYIGAAGAAHAAGDRGAEAKLLETAEALSARTPTYFGDAWVALGEIWLHSDRLGSC